MRGSGLFALVLGAGLFIIIFFGVTMLYAYLFSSKRRLPLFRDYYECGFRAVPDNRLGIDLQYAVIALIFLVYDMELLFLYPIFVNFGGLSFFSAVLVILIFFVLVLSYWYEWERYTLT